MIITNRVLASVLCLLWVALLSAVSPCSGEIKPGNQELSPNSNTHSRDALDLGRQYVKEKRYGLAVETYTNALRESSNKFELYIARSRAYIGLQRYQDALADAELAIKDSPNHPLGYSARGFALGHMDRLQESIEDFTQAIRLSPSTSQFYALRGSANLDFGQVERALADFTTAIDLGEDKVNPIVFQNRAFAFRKLGRYEDALRDLSESIRISPSLIRSRLSRGSVYRCLKKYELAKHDLDEVIKQEPDNLEAHLQRAFVSMDQNDYQSAFTDLNYANRKGMKDPYLLLSLAYAHYRLGNSPEAINVNDKATTLFPDKLQATATLQKGIFLLASRKLDAGLEALSVGQELARKEKDPVSIEDTLNDLDQLEAQGLITSGSIKRNRDGLTNTLENLRAMIGVRHKCRDS